MALPNPTPEGTTPPPAASPPTASPPDGATPPPDDKVLQSFVEEDLDIGEDSNFSTFEDDFLAGPVDGDGGEPEAPVAASPSPPASPASGAASSPAPTPPQQPAVVPPSPAPAAEGGVSPAAPAPSLPAADSGTPTPATSPAPVAAAPAAADPQEVYRAWRNDAETQLAQGHFKMSDELVAEAESDPGKFARETLPRLAAKVYLDAVAAASSAINAVLPNVIQNITRSQVEHSKAEDEFFSAWPQIDRSAHRAKVIEVGKSWRAVNPQAPKEQYIREVGALTALALGLPLQAAAVSAPAAAPAPRTPPHVPITTSAPRAAPPPANGQIGNAFDFGGARGAGFGVDDDE